MYHTLWYFMIYAFLGWCAEVCFAAANEGRFVNRGFLNGPVCPIYGFGMVLVIHFLTPLQHNALVLFVGSVILTSLIELIGGWTLKKLFHQVWWDYSDLPFHLGGYICLKFSLLWGFGCMLVMEFIQPLTLTLVGAIPLLAGNTLLAVLFILLTIDCAATVQSIAKLNRQLRQLDEIAAKLKEVSNEIGEGLWDGASAAIEKSGELKSGIAQKKQAVAGDLVAYKTGLAQKTQATVDELSAYKAELKSRYAQLLESGFFGRKRLLFAFPGMKSLHWHESLRQLQTQIFKKKA